MELPDGEEVAPFLGRIEPYLNLMDDHRTRTYSSALASARAASRLEPQLSAQQRDWTPFTATETCMSCKHDFTWASTSSSAAQRCLDMYHWYAGSSPPPTLPVCSPRTHPHHFGHPPLAFPQLRLRRRVLQFLQQQ